VVDQETEAILRQRSVSTQQRKGRRALQEGAGRRVTRHSQEVVGGRVTNVEPDGRVKLDQLDQVGLAKLARLVRRPGQSDEGADLGDGSTRLDTKGLPSLAVEPATPEHDARGLNLCRGAARV